ncbi:MAG TPA: tRNA pseudouridine(55) synthase TruB [Thiotrichaceae bacterium]|jgi:tRNA pseudouridine55 synthase|nr:tRNA pseudouridine(55) synthase TruB [Thiotrichaceae bacterium]HIM08727.1 tRNA pseudouridine(55) synthase TruB [Gammaproteobacteria bacterium]
MARQRIKRGRNISGILVLDKPAGMSSNGVLQHVKRLYDAKKAGHTGNLDVPATGLLPICLGEATKVSAFLLDANKSYRARCKLGVTTTTGDAAGEVLTNSPVPEISELNLEKVLKKFLGEIEQVPPMYSALKHNGKRLYELAYKGIEVERKSRKITIHSIKLLELSGDEFEIEVSCTKGTYIRTLAEDIGHELGCGAHILTLRRLEAGPFNESQMVTPAKLQEIAEQGMEQLDKLLLPMDIALTHFPEVRLSEEVAYYLCRGQAVTVSGLPKSGRLRIYNNLDQFLGLGEVSEDGRLAPKRLINLV